LDIKEVSKHNKRHPWELSRSKQLLKEINRYKDKPKHILDVGAGDLFLSKTLNTRFPKSHILSIDTAFKEEKKQGMIHKMKNISKVKNNSCDLCLILDVLEHIDEDYVFLSNVIKKIEHSGILIITVPAFQFLYSEHDLFLEHKRRYRLKEIKKLVKQNGLEVKKYFYFYFSLFLIRVVQKLFNIKASTASVAKWKYSRNSLQTKIIKFLLDFDYLICENLKKIGVTIPGLSICIIAKKYI
jgi:trans-aconitate methyltransferase